MKLVYVIKDKISTFKDVLYSIVLIYAYFLTTDFLKNFLFLTS